METGGNGCSYVKQTFLHRKCKDYEIMQAPFRTESSNLCGKNALYLKKCGPSINMMTLADYALNHVITITFFWRDWLIY